MEHIYKMDSRPEALPENMVLGQKYRITMLTDSLVRLEYNEEGVFEDRATQSVLNRDFPEVAMSMHESDDEIEIVTDKIRLVYDRGPFSAAGLQISVIGKEVWHYGIEVNDLRGTCRTLDTINGSCPLQPGIMSDRQGFSVLDDSKSLAITREGWVEPRKKGTIDLYVWCYGNDYLRALKDFYYLCGKTPMLPRFVLGNWWSRYYEYSEASYMELMHRFDAENIPFSVAVIDMDWHLVDIDPKYGTGWTGYTWNRDLFPDPERFLDALHDRGMHITLNVHPADGIRAFEELYPDIAQAMGKDVDKEEPVTFDIADPAFLSAYFKYVMHEHENRGVDFWWIDWQQGGVTRMEGLDPLWMLNHFHYLDNGRDGKRPMTFSRYAGPGSHRYPVGFSGDTIITWESLQFQPYFTANATNIGYGWWSHDIGGHCGGYKDDELEARWYQYGVFSPINRLHSTKNEFNGKEPWRFKREIREVMGDYLRLRHRLIPYLYTMNHRAWEQDIPLVLPMYYHHPKDRVAFEMKNEYEFGSELIVNPVVTPMIKGLNRAKTAVWLPEGTWIDFFNGMIYDGGRTIDMYRGIDELPVLAKAGAIVPLQTEADLQAALTNPKHVQLRIFGGADGSFTLYEDDNETCDYEKNVCAKTRIDLRWNGNQAIVIGPVEGIASLLPSRRTWTIELNAVTEVPVLVKADGELLNVTTSYDRASARLTIKLPAVRTGARITIAFGETLQLAENDYRERIYRFLDQAEIDFDTKSKIYDWVLSRKSPLTLISMLQAAGLEEDLVKCLSEFITAQA